MLIRNGLTANMTPNTLLGGGFMSCIPDHLIMIAATSGGFGKLAAMPWGHSHPYAIAMPITAGGMASFRGVAGEGDATASIAGGKNAAAALTGAGDLEGVGQLIVSMLAAISGSGTISSAAAQAFLQLAASLAGEGDITAAASALGNAAAALQGDGDLDAVATALGTLAASINVTGDLLSTANVADAILDAINSIEQGVTLREATRLILAAAAGKVSISGNTVTMRNAVADDTDRIIATTTTEGERTAITYDTE
jgi:hypothetical protein